MKFYCEKIQMSSKSQQKAKKTKDENNLKRIIETNLQLTNQMLVFKKSLTETKASVSDLKTKYQQQSIKCAKKEELIKNLKIQLKKLENERFRNDLVVLDESGKIFDT